MNLHLENGFLSEAIRRKYFPGMGVRQLRDTLEAMGLDRHMPIEYTSTEVCIKTPKGILMQVRVADNGALGMWGGVLQDGEDPLDGALRELAEETGLKLSKNELKFIEMNPHNHRYANGDCAKFRTYRFVVELAEVPDIALDAESTGYELVKDEEGCSRVLSHQKEFIERMLMK